MNSGRSSFALQTATPTPGVGELVEYWPSVIRSAWFLVTLFVVLAVGWYVLVPVVSRVVRSRNRNNPTIEEAVSRYVRLVVLVVAVFLAGGVAGYGGFLSNSALIIAAATVAVSVAGQSVVGSLVSGLALVADPQFNVGNYIRWTDGEGTVQSITLRVTRVLTVDGELVTVPNTALTAGTVTRPYWRRYRVVDRIGIAYEDDVTDAIAHLEAATERVDTIADAPTPKAYVDEFGPDSVIVRVHYWVESPQQRDLFAVRSAYARAAKAALDGAGITISPASKRDLQGRVEVEDAA